MVPPTHRVLHSVYPCQRRVWCACGAGASVADQLAWKPRRWRCRSGDRFGTRVRRGSAGSCFMEASGGHSSGDDVSACRAAPGGGVAFSVRSGGIMASHWIETVRPLTDPARCVVLSAEGRQILANSPAGFTNQHPSTSACIVAATVVRGWRVTVRRDGIDPCQRGPADVVDGLVESEDGGCSCR